jgi:TetR/AcrR family transcriptional regulator, regulator of biofilm formation and stress response
LTAPVQERGRRRRDALLDAAIRLLEQGGFAAVSHRAVAERAGLPLAATTYYFRSRDDLVRQAFARLIDHELAAQTDQLAACTERLTDNTPAAVAAALVAVLLPDDDADRVRQLALWELYLQAAREPALRELARSWTDGCRAMTAGLLRSTGYPHEAEDARLVLATVEGLIIEALVEGRPDGVPVLAGTLARVLAALRG